jgi:hypothetical protein
VGTGQPTKLQPVSVIPKNSLPSSSTRNRVVIALRQTQSEEVAASLCEQHDNEGIAQLIENGNVSNQTVEAKSAESLRVKGLSKTYWSAPFVFLGGLPFGIVGMIVWGIGMGAQDSLLKAVLANVVPVENRRLNRHEFENLTQSREAAKVNRFTTRLQRLRPERVARQTSRKETRKPRASLFWTNGAALVTETDEGSSGREQGFFA